MDVDLPVWTIRPNWSQGVLERLEWLTDVIASEVGVEQRRSVRLSPRRSFEITVNPTDAERTYLDLVMHRLGSVEWLFPLWHDQGRLSAIGQKGQTAVLVDTTFREYRPDDYVLFFRDAFNWEVAKIDALTDDGLLLTEKLVADWPRNTIVYPLRRATVQTETQISAITSRVGQSVLLFQMNEANDFDEDVSGLPSYLGSPMIVQEPNRSQEITLAHTRLFAEQDGEIGLRYRVDDAGRAFSAQSHSWMIQGREAQTAFRKMLYYLRGQQRMVWLPSFNDDLFISRPIAAGANRGDIRKVGLGYVGGPIPGRARFWTGKEVVLHAAMLAALSEDEERLTFTTGVTNAYAAGDTWSFMEPARLNTDTIEIQHHTDSDGVCEVATSFKTFANDRVAGLPIYLPTPEGVQSNVLCGEPPDKDKNPCYVAPSDIKLIVTLAPTEFYCNPRWDGNVELVIPVTQPNGPGGRVLQRISLPRGGDPVPVTAEYENTVPGSPFLGGQVLYDYTKSTFNDMIVRLYFDVNPGDCYFHIFPSARYCSSGGGPKDPDGYGRSTVSVATPTRVLFSLGPFQVGGNTDTYWRWTL